MMISEKVRKPQKWLKGQPRRWKDSEPNSIWEIQVETEIESQNEEGDEESPKGQAIKENEPQMSRSDQLKEISVQES